MFSGCKNDTVNSTNIPVDVQIVLNDTTGVMAGQMAGLANGELVFKYDSIISDTRCPVGAICLSNDDASIHLTFPKRVDTLHTYSETVYGNYTIKLIDLFPYRRYRQYTNTFPSCALLLVTKN
jgi:hypothetical protein